MGRETSTVESDQRLRDERGIVGQFEDRIGDTAADAIEKFMKDDKGARYARLVAAEQALSAVLRFHQSATQREIRVGSEWLPMENRLRTLLIDSLLGQMDALIESKAWKAAFDASCAISSFE